MHYYRSIIQYAGTHYAGFQWQAGVSTIQGTINAALSTYGLKHFSTSGASRTDTGVHALAQVIKICSDRPLEVNHFIEPFNNLLPCDIRFLTIEESDWSFRPASAVSCKEYRYLFTNDLQQSDFIANFNAFVHLILKKYLSTFSIILVPSLFRAIRWAMSILQVMLLISLLPSLAKGFLLAFAMPPISHGKLRRCLKVYILK